MEEKAIALSAKNVGKHFKIYKDRPLTLKDRILSFVKKSYEEFWALKDINIEINKGEAVGLIGHNGCGKSTLLKLFTRIIYPEKGTIEVHGQVSSLLELGAGFHPDFTGRENIYTNASIFGMTKKEIDTYLQDIIDFSELGEFIDNPVRTYSSGMYMRLAFSVAIHVKPEILLIDEILAVGDSNFQKKCLDKIAEFRKNGVTIVIVSHDLGTIERICDKVVWLDSGVIRQQGAPMPVINAYLAHMAQNQHEQLFRKIELVNPSEAPTLPVSAEKESDVRCGNRDAELLGVFTLDPNGETKTVFDVEDPMDIVIQYKKNKPLEDVRFSIGIFSADGQQRYSTNSAIDRGVCEIGERGAVVFSMERLGLIEGSYWIDIALHDASGTPFDYIARVVQFKTESPIKDVGAYRPPHKWIIH